MDRPFEAIGTEIRAHMYRQKRSIADFSQQLEVSETTLSRYIRGERDFPATVLLNALDILDVPLAEFSDHVRDTSRRRL